MTPTRTRPAWWNVPPSQQPLRARVRPRAEPKPAAPHINPLEQLVIEPIAAVPAIVRGEHGPLASHLAPGSRHLKQRFADEECEHGRLAHDPTPPCGCWAQEPGSPVPDLIPAWVLADARELRASGMTARRIATAILPVTGCPDLPSCLALLKRQLKTPTIPGDSA